MGFTIFAKLIDLSGLTAKQKKELKDALTDRDKRLKKAIKDVETVLGSLKRKPKKRKKKTAKGKL